MGTSGRNPGSRKGLVPTWVDDPIAPASPSPQPNHIPTNPAAPGSPGAMPNQLPPISSGIMPNTVSAVPLPGLPPLSAGTSLGPSRSNFSRFARSGGSSDMQRAAGGYVRAVGGAKNAARAMGPSRRTAIGIGQLASDIAQHGAADALRTFSLQSLAGAPASDVFVALTDVLCPAGGTIDEAIARNAMLETVAEMGTAADIPFDALPPAALEAFFLSTISRSIEAKLFSELGGKAIRLPTDVTSARAIQRVLHDYIEGTVRDRFITSGQTLATTSHADVGNMVQSIYEQSFQLLQVLGEQA